MKRLSLLPAALLIAAPLLLPSCEEKEVPFSDEEKSSEQLDTDTDTGTPPTNRAPNEYNRHTGMTELTEVSDGLLDDEEDLREAIVEKDEEMQAFYRDIIASKKARIRELLRAGADPWARSLSQRGYLAPCARQHWSQEFVEELRKEGFIITDTPSAPNTPATPQ